MRYIIFILIFFYPLNIFASSTEQIKNKLKETNNMSFKFIQKIGKKTEKGDCIISYPKKILCKYDDIYNIQTIVCKYFKISKNEMLSPRRSRYLVRPRQTAIYLAKMLTSKSLPEIGRSFANRDHTTVIHSVKTIEKLRKDDNELNLSIDSLKNKILYKQENEI